MIRRFFIFLTLLSFLLCSVASSPVWAQDAQPSAMTEAEKRAAAAKAREEAELRIEEQMVEMTSLVEALAKNLGQLHYLRTLCFGDDDQKWRVFAQDMMSMENKNNSANKSRLVRAFNAGYYQEEGRHEQCDRSVSVDVAALAENGRHIASMLGDPYRDF